MRTKEEVLEQGLPAERPSDECWEWTMSRSNGYGQTSNYGPAHRLAYEVFVGPIPEGLHILHSCDNPPCCNPTHLRAGTSKENARDRIARGRNNGGANQPHHLSDRRGIDLPDETWRLLKAHAARRGQTLGQLFRDMAADVVGWRAVGYPEPRAMREMTEEERAEQRSEGERT